MKKHLLLIFFQLAMLNAFSQAGVGIGVTTPDASATLHVQPPTNNKGMLIPRLTTDERNNVASPAEGLLVYDTDLNALYHFNGTWQPVGTPPGVISMWSGTTPPPGWALCDGTGGRPDLRERFIVGAGGDNTSVAGAAYANGATGGVNTVTLTAAQIPAHSHTMQSAGDHSHYVKEVNRGDEGSSGVDQSVGSYDEGGAEKYTSTAGAHTHTINNNTGGGGAHENRPPYYALAFIIKL
jgi:microcystin-dependent protein